MSNHNLNWTPRTAFDQIQAAAEAQPWDEPRDGFLPAAETHRGVDDYWQRVLNLGKHRRESRPQSDD